MSGVRGGIPWIINMSVKATDEMLKIGIQCYVGGKFIKRRIYQGTTTNEEGVHDVYSREEYGDL